MESIEVDGSTGEGGGQILRTALSFSAILRKPVRVFNIRAGRPEPGLKRQHASALQILGNIFGGELSGAREGSSVVSFAPSNPRLRSLSVDMRTAASITLVLQAVVPAVALNRSPLKLDLVGGTDVPWSPTFDYFAHVVRPAFKKIGINFSASAERRGYYPRGGGRVSAAIEPSASLEPLNLVSGGAVPGAVLLSRCGSLPRHVAERQLSAASALLEGSGIRVQAGDASAEPSDSPGSSVLVRAAGEGRFLGADGIGARGRPAEEVGRGAASSFVSEARSGACLDSNLADMVIPLLALARSRSRVRISEVTSHLKSGMGIASQFTSSAWSVAPEGGSVVVEVTPAIGPRAIRGHNV